MVDRIKLAIMLFLYGRHLKKRFEKNDFGRRPEY